MHPYKKPGQKAVHKAETKKMDEKAFRKFEDEKVAKILGPNAQELINSWEGDDFGITEAITVKQLIEEENLSQSDAIQEINNLQGFQVISLKNNYRHGLTGDLLRSWKRDTDDAEFSLGHGLYLDNLIKDKERSLSPAEAINEVKGLSKQDAYQRNYFEYLKKELDLKYPSLGTNEVSMGSHANNPNNLFATAQTGSESHALKISESEESSEESDDVVDNNHSQLSNG